MCCGFLVFGLVPLGLWPRDDGALVRRPPWETSGMDADDPESDPDPESESDPDSVPEPDPDSVADPESVPDPDPESSDAEVLDLCDVVFLALFLDFFDFAEEAATRPPPRGDGERLRDFSALDPPALSP